MNSATAKLFPILSPVVNEPSAQAAAAPPAQEKEEDNVTDYDFSALTNVEITGVSLQDFNQEQQEVLYQQAR